MICLYDAYLLDIYNYRFLQCVQLVFVDGKPTQYVYWPHTYNIVKYLLSVAIVIISLSFPISGTGDGPVLVFQVVLGCVLVISTIYGTFWDTYCDWGLWQIMPDGTTDPKPQLFLRKKLMYESPYKYYIAMVTDFVLRLIWAISLVPPNSY